MESTAPARRQFDRGLTQGADEPEPPPGRKWLFLAPPPATPVPRLLAIMAGGLLLAAAAATHARVVGTGGLVQAAWLTGLVVIFVPALVGAVYPGVSSAGRLVVVTSLGQMLQLARVTVAPTRFLAHDEVAHASALHQVQAGHHLFSQGRVLAVPGGYPGLEAVTEAVSATTGLPSHASAVVTLLVLRLVGSLALYAIAEHVSASPRTAALTGVLYTAGPLYLVPDSQFSPTSLALPLALLAVLAALTALAVPVRPDSGFRSLTGVMAVVLAVDVTHPGTALFLVLAFGVWSVVEVFSPDSPSSWPDLLLVALVGSVGLCATLVVHPDAAPSVLTWVSDGSADQVGRLHGARGPLLVASALVTSVALLPTLLGGRRWAGRRASAAALLLLAGLAYPVLLLGSLTHVGAEVLGPAVSLTFLGVAFTVAWWLVRRRARAWRSSVIVVAGAAVFLGNATLGAGPVSEQVRGSAAVRLPSALSTSGAGPGARAADTVGAATIDDTLRVTRER